jgi:hypothetical protein
MAPKTPSASRALRDIGRRGRLFWGYCGLLLVCGLVTPDHTPSIPRASSPIARSLSTLARSLHSQAELKGRSNWPLLAALDAGGGTVQRTRRVPVPVRRLALDPPLLAFNGERGGVTRRMGAVPDFDAYRMQTAASLVAPSVVKLLRPAAGGGEVAADLPFLISLSEDLKLNWTVRSQPGGNARTEVGVRVGLQYRF